MIEPPLFVLSPTGLLGRRREALPRIEFYVDRVVVWHDESDRRELALRDIGHVHFVPPGRIAINYGISRPRFDLSAEVRVSRLIGEDRFDQVVRHLETHVPEHLFSNFDRTRLHHSLPFALEEVLRTTKPVSDARARLVGRDPLLLEYSTNHQSWSVAHESGFVLRSASDAGDAGDAGDETVEPHLQLLRSQFYRTNGMVLGSMPQFESSAYAIDTGGADSIIVHEVMRSLFRNNKCIGSYRGQGGEQEIQFDEPVPEALALLVLLAQTQCQLLPGAEPAVVDITDDPELSLFATGFARHWRAVLVWIAIGLLGLIMLFSTLPLNQQPIAFAGPIAMLAVSLWSTRNRVLEGIEVFHDRLRLSHNQGKRGASIFVTPSDIGHLTYERGNILRVWFGAKDHSGPQKKWKDVFGGKGPFAQVMLGERRTEARDDLMRHLAAMSDRHVCSFEDDTGRLSYSRSWTFEELVPWQHQVTKASLQRDRGVGMRVTTPAATYPVARDEGYVLFMQESSERVRLLLVGRERVFFHNGMVLGVHKGGHHLRLGSGENVTIDAHSGEVQIDKEPLGRLFNEGESLCIELTEPRCELLLIVILLTFAASNDGVFARLPNP